MTMRCRFVLYGLLGIQLAAVASGADETPSGEPDSRAFPCDRLLDGSATAAPGERWDRVTHSDFELTSHPRQPKGYFEFYAFPSDKNEDLRAITLDDRGSARMVLFRGQDWLPAKLVVNDQWMVVNASGAWERRSTEKPWSIAFDQNHLYDFADPTGVPAENHGFIKYSLGAYLSAVMGGETPATSWSNSTRTLTALKSNNTKVQLRFRTPQDQRRLGTLLSELAIRSSNGSEVSHRCFIVNRESPLRLNVAGIDELSEELDAEDAGDRPGPKFITLDSAPERMAALKLQSKLSALDCVDDRPTKAPEARSRFQEALVVGMDDSM